MPALVQSVWSLEFVSGDGPGSPGSVPDDHLPVVLQSDIPIGVILPSGTPMLFGPVATEVIGDRGHVIEVVHGIALESRGRMIWDGLALFVTCRAHDWDLNTHTPIGKRSVTMPP